MTPESIFYITCETCGRFAIDEDYYEYDIKMQKTNIGKSEIASYLYYQKDVVPFPFFCDEKRNAPRSHRRVDVLEVNNWCPKTFNEKVDTFLLGLASRMNYFSEPILFSYEQLKSACFVSREPKGPMRKMQSVNDQLNFFLNYLEKQEYIEPLNNGYVLLPKGLERIDGLQKNTANITKNVFVAMSFVPEMKEVREEIKSAIIECGFTPRIMDEIEHNHQIVPEMLYEIRQSRFVIAELTGHNNGAYYEAGYALGLGKEVIHMCDKSQFGKDGHFDVKQVNTVLWEGKDEIKDKLVKRIKATIN